MTTPKSQNPEGKVGPLDLSAPPKVWLQVDTNGDDEDRSEEIGEANWGELTWHYESIGGQEVVYIRQDIAATTYAAMQRRLGEITVAAAAVLKRDGDTACKCIHISRKAEREYESGTCPHQRLATLLRGDGKGDET